MHLVNVAKVRVSAGGEDDTESLLGASTSIGRATENDVVLDDPRVSRRHAVIRVDGDGRYLLSDLGSANGTYLNGRRVLVPTALTTGCVIQIGGSSLTFIGTLVGPAESPDTEEDVTHAGPLPSTEATVLGTGPAMAEVFRLMEKAAASGISILISGETGTGKELVARAVHSVSQRRQGPFLAVNCAALPETLLESQLFGHRRGSFTGATEDRVGLFEGAEKGTVFLDEIGEMAPAMQPKFLRVLQEGEVVPVGDTRPRHVDVRVISATNRDLETEVRRGKFREDLYYRLAAFPITLPPLRDRKEDIPLLAERFVAAAARQHGKRIPGIQPAARHCLVAFEWPGNVRELQNEINRAVVLASDGEPISIAHLSRKVAAAASIGARDSVPEGPPPAGEAEGGSLRGARDAFEARYIARVLREQGGNISRAAEVLGLSRVALHRKIKEYGIR